MLIPDQLLVPVRLWMFIPNSFGSLPAPLTFTAVIVTLLDALMLIPICVLPLTVTVSSVATLTPLRKIGALQPVFEPPPCMEPQVPAWLTGLTPSVVVAFVKFMFFSVMLVVVMNSAPLAVMF